MSQKKELTPGDQIRLAQTWKKLVRLFHPDKHQKDLERRKKYEELTAYINQAKEEGDLDKLEEIASDPEAFVQGKVLVL